MKREENQERVIIYSVSPLDDEEIKILGEKFPFLKNSKIINKINPRLLGGVIIQTKNEIIDYSLHNRLVDLKKIVYEISA